MESLEKFSFFLVSLFKDLSIQKVFLFTLDPLISRFKELKFCRISSATASSH